jgi:hypothetical protein
MVMVRLTLSHLNATLQEFSRVTSRIVPTTCRQSPSHCEKETSVPGPPGQCPQPVTLVPHKTGQACRAKRTCCGCENGMYGPCIKEERRRIAQLQHSA